MIFNNFGSRNRIVAGIELGGTSASIALSDGLGSFVFKKKGFPTKNPIDPKIPLQEMIDAVKATNKKIDAIGIASFGPVDIRKGNILETPKPNWSKFPLIQEVKKLLPNIPIVLDTDVNAPAYSEYLAFNDPNIKSIAYITIGTGIGLGLFADGHCYHGSMHPEAGHIIPKRIAGDNFPGICKFHDDCIEGLISAPALGKRKGIPYSQIANIPSTDQVWKYFTGYFARMIASCHLAYSLHTVVLGGGIITGEGRENLIDDIRIEVKKLLCGYVKEPIISLPHFGKDAGLVGACAIAMNPELFQTF